MPGKLFSKIYRSIEAKKIKIKELFSDLVTVINNKMNPFLTFEIMDEGINKIVISRMNNRML